MTNNATSEWRGTHVLITGGSGFVGRWMIRRLLGDGATVINADVVRPSAACDGLETAEFREIDLVDPQAFARLVDETEPDHVIHLAGQAGVAACARNPVEAFDANVRATIAVLEGVRTACWRGVRAVTATSSNHVYGEQRSHDASREDAPLNGLGTYAATKACADVLCRCYAHQYALPVAVARITNSFGGDDPHASHIVTATIASCLRGERPTIRGSGRDTKAFLHVEDSVDGILALAGATAGGRVEPGTALNIVPGEPISVLELVRAIMERTGIEGDPVIERPQAEAEFEHLDASAAERLIGWRSRRTLAEALTETIDWYRRREPVAK